MVNSADDSSTAIPITARRVMWKWAGCLALLRRRYRKKSTAGECGCRSDFIGARRPSSNAAANMPLIPRAHPDRSGDLYVAEFSAVRTSQPISQWCACVWRELAGIRRSGAHCCDHYWPLRVECWDNQFFGYLRHLLEQVGMDTEMIRFKT